MKRWLTARSIFTIGETHINTDGNDGAYQKQPQHKVFQGSHEESAERSPFLRFLVVGTEMLLSFLEINRSQTMFNASLKFLLETGKT